MRISKKQIKETFSAAEKDLEYCWNILAALKQLEKNQEDTAKGLALFQDRLAHLILQLNKLRTQIIAEEKDTIKNKSNYNRSWFIARLKLLGSYKEGIDSIVNIGKALGDAYAYFFYRNDLQMLEEHRSHQRIINSAAGIGEVGEIEFLKRLKHFEGNFTLYHGITNILRYGDYSFIDLNKHRVVQIGELKTKQVDENKLEFTLTVLQYTKPKKQSTGSDVASSHIEKNKSSRKERQLEGLAGFMKRSVQDVSLKYGLQNQTYFAELEQLYLTTKTSDMQCKKVSPGLAFSLFKFRKSGLYGKFYYSRANLINKKLSSTIVETARQLIKPDSNENGLILGQILYNPDYSDKATPGTPPFFWYPLSLKLLKKLYFMELNITSIFNPIHLISDAEALGFAVKSKYIKKTEERMKGKEHYLQKFDLFFSYIVNHLLTEQFVIDSLKEVLNNAVEFKGKQVLLKPLQRIF